MLKIGIIGLGSMGKRRVRDLLKLGCEVVGFDLKEDRNKEAEELFKIQTFTTFDQLMKNNLNACVISVPTDMHAYYYQLCFENNLPFFSEAGIFTPQLSWFEERERKYNVKSYPSATWRFHPVFNEIKNIVSKKGLSSINSVHYHYGGYLPTWHPWENYWDYYAGIKKTSAAREMVPFEMEWLTYVFGKVKMVSSYKGQLSKWKTDMDDSYFLHLIFENGIFANLIIELHQTNPFRYGKISMKDGSLDIDMISNRVTKYDLESDSYKLIKIPGARVMTGFNFEDVYYMEMENFKDALSGKINYVKDWADDRHVSDILFASEKSCEEKRWITVDDIKDCYDGVNW